MGTNELTVEVTAPAAERARIERLVRATLESEDRTLDRVSVSFVDLGTMTRLNRKHRNRTGPTDVLTWPFDGSFPQGTGGEVVVCPEQADPAPERAVDRLVVHGVLHLLGYEDETAAGLEDMERRTDLILERDDG